MNADDGHQPSRPIPGAGTAEREIPVRFSLAPLRQDGPDSLTPNPATGILRVNLTRIDAAIQNACHQTVTHVADDLFRAAALESADLFPPSANQIGSWSPSALPVFLTLQTETSGLRTVIAELGTRLRKPYVLISPTAKLLTATSHELLAHDGAALARRSFGHNAGRPGTLICADKR